MQAKYKTLGCTLVVTQNYLITLREDFSAPLKQWHMLRNMDPTMKSGPDGGSQKAQRSAQATKGRLDMDHLTAENSSLVTYSNTRDVQII